MELSPDQLLVIGDSRSTAAGLLVAAACKYTQGHSEIETVIWSGDAPDLLPTEQRPNTSEAETMIQLASNPSLHQPTFPSSSLHCPLPKRQQICEDRPRTIYQHIIFGSDHFDLTGRLSVITTANPQDIYDAAQLALPRTAQQLIVDVRQVAIPADIATDQAMAQTGRLDDEYAELLRQEMAGISKAGKLAHHLDLLVAEDRARGRMATRILRSTCRLVE